MDHSARITTNIYGNPVRLIFNEFIQLIENETTCKIELNTPDIDNLNFTIEFTDKPNPEGKTGYPFKVETEDGNVKFICYSWYSDGWVQGRPHKISEMNGERKYIFLIRTTAERSVNARVAHVSIWIRE
jgi:hypothetical protein